MIRPLLAMIAVTVHESWRGCLLLLKPALPGAIP